jgi:hypothetical protein
MNSLDTIAFSPLLSVHSKKRTAALVLSGINSTNAFYDGISQPNEVIILYKSGCELFFGYSE